MRIIPGTRPLTPWGKLSPRETPTDYHPLIDHCVDVAVVTEQLLQRTLLGARLAALAGRPDLDSVTIARLAVIAGLHDIGKANHGFQNKAVPGLPTAGHVGEGLSLIEQARQDPALHGPLGQPQLAAWTGQPLEMFDLLKAAICHHGRFVAAGHHRQSDWLPKAHHRPLDTLTDLWAVLLHAFPDALNPSASPLPQASPFVHAFSGLIMLADWIGSDTRAFPYAEEADGPRILRARPAAIAVLAHLGLDARLPREALRRGPATFAAWTGLPAPRGPQTALVDQPLPADAPCATAPAPARRQPAAPKSMKVSLFDDAQKRENWQANEWRGPPGHLLPEHGRPRQTLALAPALRPNRLNQLLHLWRRDAAQVGPDRTWAAACSERLRASIHRTPRCARPRTSTKPRPPPCCCACRPYPRGPRGSFQTPERSRPRQPPMPRSRRGRHPGL